MGEESSALSFESAVRAGADLARIEHRLAPALMLPLASLLSTCPDPDGALGLLERYAEASPPELLEELARTPTALTYLVAVFGHGAALAETFLAEPALPIQFARDRNFAKIKSKEDLMQDYARFSITNPDPWLSSQLARFKRRNYLRLVLKDVLGLSTLSETALELSILADVILSNALLFCDQELEKRYGQPQYRDPQGRIVRSGFSVVSLGKLGGNELNYGSDIELLFIYSHDGETSGSSERNSIIANKEYFVRLAEAVTRTIRQPTPEGEVFRVDLRARPEGDRGDLAISVGSALQYYQHRARDWELQMLIKARHSAGGSKLTRDFLHGVESCVYGSPGDFAAVESVLLAREKISKKTRESRGSAIDVERHRGAIRDIEFLTQCLQRLLGVRDPWVRSGGTLLALRKLNDKGWLSDGDYASLSSAYEFLRRVEHRVQLESGQQNYRLPSDSGALNRLARRVGPEGGLAESAGEALLRKIQDAFRRVDEIYQRVIHPHVGASSRVSFELQPLSAASLAPGVQSHGSILSYLDAHASELARLMREYSASERARRHAAQLFAALLGASERFRLAREQPQLVRRALEVVEASDYLGDLLVRHPEDIAMLESMPLIPAAHKAGAQREMGFEISDDRQDFAWLTGGGLGIRESMALLRQHYRGRILELGAADLMGGRPIFSVLAGWSNLAREAVSSALEVARDAVGEPVAVKPIFSAIPIAVLALGRLGINEFDLGSDAELIFVLGSETPREDFARWMRVAEKTIEVLSSYTRDGTLFAVDTRLGPHGHEGELVVTGQALVDYLAQTDQIGTALMYLNTRAVAGNLQLGRQTVTRLIACLLDRFVPEDRIKGKPREIWRSVRGEMSDGSSCPHGALRTYNDTVLALSLLRLRHRLTFPAGRNIPDQVKALSLATVISPEEARLITEGAGFLRSIDHAVRLITGTAANGFPEHTGHLEALECMVRRWGVSSDISALAKRSQEVQGQLIEFFERVVSSE